MVGAVHSGVLGYVEGLWGLVLRKLLPPLSSSICRLLTQQQQRTQFKNLSGFYKGTVDCHNPLDETQVALPGWPAETPSASQYLGLMSLQKGNEEA